MSQMPETTTDGRLVITTNSLHVDSRDVENIPDSYTYDGFHAYSRDRVYHYYRKTSSKKNAIQYSSVLTCFAPDLADSLVTELLDAMMDAKTKDAVLAWALYKGFVKFPT